MAVTIAGRFPGILCVVNGLLGTALDHIQAIILQLRNHDARNDLVQLHDNRGVVLQMAQG